MKTFTLQYDPFISFNQLAGEMKKAVKTGKPSVHPHRIRVSNLETLWLNPTTLRLFSLIVDYQPNSLHQLAKLAQKNCAEIEKDVSDLEILGIIKLEKTGKKIKPVACYDRIVFDFRLTKEKTASLSPWK